MSKTSSRRDQRACAPSRKLACVTAIAAAMSFVLGAATSADAKPTGWRAPSELVGHGVDAWAGYGDAGYVGRPQAKARHASTKSASARKAGFRAAMKKSGYAAKATAKTVKYAALKEGLPDVTPEAKSLTGGGVRWTASSSCLNGTLVAVISQVAANYGPVTVNSTCRSRGHNAAVGGARHSQHLTGDAVDFRVRGNVSAVYAFLKSSASVGGYKHYGGGLFHIDTGPRRTW